MATTFDFRISCDRSRLREADSVLLECHHRVERLERELSEFLEGGPVYRLNRMEPFKEVEIPLSVIELLEQSEIIRKKSNGAFDCTVKSGPLSQESPVRIAWERARGVAWKVTPDARLSFAAIGKGYALDRVRDLIDRHGFGDYLLNAGGSSQVFAGFSSPDVPWSWAWSWKRDEQGEDLGIPFEHITGDRISIGISGLHEKGEHLVDPRTGEKAVRCQSALVAHPSACLADAFSTALFVSSGEYQPADSAVPFATASIDSAGIPRWNGWFQKFWGSPERSGVANFLVVFAAVLTLAAPAFADAPGGAEESIDLGSLGVSKFNPYLFDRHGWLAVFPALAIVLVLVHLIQPKLTRKSKLASQKKGSPT